VESDRRRATNKNGAVHDWPTIDDPADARLADYIGLTDRDIVRRHETEQFFIAEGPEVVRRLVASGLPIRSIVLAPNRVDDMAAALVGVSAPVFVAERAVISAVAGFDLHRGVIASASRPPLTSLDEVLARNTPHGRPHRLAVLEGLNDHENLGAIARSARAFEIDALVLDPTCADPYYRRTIRVSMGEILFLPIVRSSIADVITTIRRHGGSSLALTPDRSAPSLAELDVRSDGPLALVLGSEGFGLDATTLEACDSRARIPIASDVDSLNVGHAAAVAFALTHRPA
jgi:tRNA G18 (ribose-2'-O)-methylase SpoU